jgi:hypothetical protein
MEIELFDPGVPEKHFRRLSGHFTGIVAAPAHNGGCIIETQGDSHRIKSRPQIRRCSRHTHSNAFHFTKHSRKNPRTATTNPKTNVCIRLLFIAGSLPTNQAWQTIKQLPKMK